MLTNTGVLLSFAVWLRIQPLFSAKSSHVTERLCASQTLLAIYGKIKLLHEENSSFHIIMFTSTCAGPDKMLCEE